MSLHGWSPQNINKNMFHSNMGAKLFVVFLIINSLCLLCCNCLTLSQIGTAPNRLEDERFLENPHYDSNEGIQDLFNHLQKQFPSMVKVHVIGESRENRELTVIQINQNVRKRGLLTPMFKYVANMHGDETVGRQMLIYLAQYLLFNYGKIDEVTKLVNETDIFLMPTMNPDGYERSKVSQCLI